MNKYFKNFILCGDIDQYCLLCKETFQLIPDIEKHIRWEKHRKNVKEQNYLPKFQKDLIYKIGSKYYCEICNELVENMILIKEHIRCDRHMRLKNNPEAEIKKPAGLYQSGYVLIHKVILSKAQWHSIVNKKCRICNVDVINVDEHVALEEHMLNLLRCETTYAGDQYYRKVNVTTYHCFACKKIYAAEDFENHWEDCENIDEIEVKALKDAETAATIEKFTESVACIEEVEQQLFRTFQEFYLIDEGNNSAICKFCSASVPIDFKPLLLHLREVHHRKDDTPKPESSSDESTADNQKPPEVIEVIDHGKKRSELSKYGKAHNIKLNYNGTKGYCTICDKYLSASKPVFKEHCKGLIHKGHLELLGLKEPDTNRISIDYDSESILKFAKSLHYAGNSHSAVINNELSVNMNAFLLVHPIENNPHCYKTKCFACKELFKQGKEGEHGIISTHKENFLNAKILTKPEEFVREVHTNLFHCGFCNVTLPFSNALEIHLQSLKHKKSKDLRESMIEADLADIDTEADEATPEGGDQYTGLLNNFCDTSKL